MVAPSDPVVAIRAPEVMKMPPPTQPEIPIPTLLQSVFACTDSGKLTRELRSAEDTIEVLRVRYIVWRSIQWTVFLIHAGQQVQATARL